MNLLYCGNEGVFDGIMLSLLSAAKKATCPLHAYVLTMDLAHLHPNYTTLTAQQIDYIDGVLKELDSGHTVERIDATLVFLAELGSSPNMSTSYTPYALLRLVADKLPLPDKILYVDCDTLFSGDIAALEAYDISNCELAAVVDHLGRRFIARDYLNAGVLYLNLPEIRRTGLLERCRALCVTKMMPFPDQDSINRLATQKLVLPTRFNQQDGLHEDTVIHHFSKTIRFFPWFQIINVKPWELELVQEVLGLDAYDQLFADYLPLREAISGTLIAPRKPVRRRPAMQQLRNDIHEVLSFADQKRRYQRATRKDAANQ